MIIKSFNLQLVSVELDGADFAPLEVPTSSLMGTLKHLLVILTLFHADKIGKVIHFYTGGIQPEQRPAVAILHLRYWLSFLPQASAINSSDWLGWFIYTIPEQRSIFYLNYNLKFCQALSLWSSEYWRKLCQQWPFPNNSPTASFSLNFHHSDTCLNYSSEICLTLLLHRPPTKVRTKSLS